MAERQALNRSVSRKFFSCASTESHSTISTNRFGVSMPRVIRTERQPSVLVSCSRAPRYAASNPSASVTSMIATSRTMGRS